MRERLARAYETVIGKKPDSKLAEWQVAAKVLENWDVLRLGEEQARQIVLFVVNHVQFPNLDITRQIVGRAESLATELWPQLPEEPHMAQLEHLEGGNYGG